MKFSSLETTVLFFSLSMLFTPSCAVEKIDTTCTCLNNGICNNGYCDCPPDYTGTNCETYVGGTTCQSTPYYGTQNCASGSVAVTNSLCCPATHPYLGVQTNQCFTTCEAAQSAGNSTISFGTGQTGGGGGTCISTPYYGPQNCPSGAVAVSGGCCPAVAPYYGVQTNWCYATCEAAKSAGNSTISFGTGQTGGGGNDCNWNSATNCVSVTKLTGNRCGDPQSVDITVTNNCSQNIKIYICVQRTDGTWSGLPDGTFSTGTAPNGTANNFVCKGTGQYKVFAMPASDFGNYNCPWPSCN